MRTRTIDRPAGRTLTYINMGLFGGGLMLSFLMAIFILISFFQEQPFAEYDELVYLFLGGAIASTIGFQISEHRDMLVRRATRKLVEADARDDPTIANTELIASSDTGELLLCSDSDGQMRLYQITDEAVVCSMLDRSEIEKIEIHCMPKDFLSVGMTDKSTSNLSLFLGGTLVGGLGGLAVTGFIAGTLSRLKESEQFWYELFVKFYVDNREPLIFRAIDRGASIPSTRKGERELYQVIEDAQGFIESLNKYFSGKAIT